MPENYRTSIGGQALIEGILMRGPEKQAIVVRTADGLVTKIDELKLVKDRYPILGLPIIRGSVNFIDSMVKGVQALTYSADMIPIEEQEEESKLDRWIEEKFEGEKGKSIVLGLSVVLGIALSVGLFILLPTVLAGFFSFLPLGRIGRNIIEGIIRIGIFMLYLFLATRVKDVRRVFEYHGAEHKSIHCYEKGLELTVENVRPQPRQHPRCGTSFLFVVLIVSTLLFSVVSWNNVWIRIGLRLLLLPLVVGISYEINRWAGRHDNLLSSILSAPGKAMQAFTVYEPDDSMIEVAIEALKAVIPKEKGKDKW